MGHWDEFVSTMTPERTERIKHYMIVLRTPEGMTETVDCLMAAVHMLSSEGGRELAERLARRAASTESAGRLEVE